MSRSAWILVTALMLVGLVWVGQGMGILRGSSFMVDDRAWALAGVVPMIVSVAIVLGLTRRRA